MLRINRKTKKQKLLEKPKSEISNFITEIHRTAGNIFLREYKREVPVDRGDLRRNVKLKMIGNASQNSLKTTIGTKAFNNGREYGEFVHEGTGIYRGSPIDYGALTGGKGRVRKSNFYGFGSRREMNIVMSSLMKQGKIKGIRPNKFVNRTIEKAEPKAVKFILREFKKL